MPSNLPTSAAASLPASSATSKSRPRTASSPNASACSSKSPSRTRSTPPTTSTLAIGQPTHTFDLDKLEGGIVVRKARKGEKLRTLDGVERTLDPEDLIVADHVKPLGIAGVMGGWDSMITAETKNILVEAAWFDPGTQSAAAARRHGLHTDASHRFERGADFNAAPIANALVSQIVLEAGGEIEGDLVDIIIPEAQARTANRAAISLQVGEVQRILGTTESPEGITPEITESVLIALGCQLAKSSEGAYEVTLPSWRLDLEREIDLIEEVARVYGYNRFANTLPAFAGTVVALPYAEKEQTLRRTLLALGWNEAVSSTFCSAADAATFAPQPDSAVRIGNPLSEEAGMLRPSLIPGMLTMLAGNMNRDVEDIALFELGTAFSGTTDKVEERPALAFGATGNSRRKQPVPSSRNRSIFTRSKARSKSCSPSSPPVRHTSTPCPSTPDSCLRGSIPAAPPVPLSTASPSATSASCTPTKSASANLNNLSSSANST